MTQLSKRSYYTVLTVSVIAAALLVLPFQASSQTHDLMTDMSEKKPALQTTELKRVQKVDQDRELRMSDRTSKIYFVNTLQSTDETPIISSAEFYEKRNVTPNEEVAGIVVERFEDTIWNDDFVRRLDKS